MRNLIKQFPNQLLESVEISKGYSISIPSEIKNVVVCGLGGSGIGGEIIKQWVRLDGNFPVETCHNYTLPGYVNKDSLVIVCSYSGNTEETLSALQDALDRDANIIGVSSGGTLEDVLRENSKHCIKIPGGLPPRSALAYSLVQLVEIFEQCNLVSTSLKSEVVKSIHLLQYEQAEIESLAGELLKRSKSKQVLFYSEESFRPTLLRACQQINENSKALSFFNVVPEMNHNEIVGWASEPKDLFVMFIRSDLENEANKKRLDITNKIIEKQTDSITSVDAIGVGLVQQTLYLIHLLDWFSLLKAEEKGVDVTEVKIIDFLKSELAKN